MLEQTSYLKLEIPDLFQQKYFHSLDGLRALSITLVIIAHFGMSCKINFDFHPWANLGVQFFFVISGFLITTLLLKEKLMNGNISLKKFYIRRFFRIIPVAFLYLFFILFIRLILHVKLEWIYILTSFLFIRNFFMGSKGIDHLTTHYWSLSVEEQFYLIFPVILKKGTELYVFFLIFMLSIPIFLEFFLVDFVNNHIILLGLKNFSINFIGISLGSLFSVLVFKNRIVIKDNLKHKELLITLLFIIISFATNFSYLGILTTYIKCILFGIIILLLLSNADQGRFYYKILNNSNVKYVGTLSFSLYIWQQPLTQGIPYINNFMVSHGFYTNLVTNILVITVSSVILFSISYLSYNYYEIIFLRIRNKYK